MSVRLLLCPNQIASVEIHIDKHLFFEKIVLSSYHLIHCFSCIEHEFCEKRFQNTQLRVNFVRGLIGYICDFEIWSVSNLFYENLIRQVMGRCQNLCNFKDTCAAIETLELGVIFQNESKNEKTVKKKKKKALLLP